jgi:hypothetical protein
MMYGKEARIFEEWLLENYRDLFEEWELGESGEYLDLDEWVKRNYYEVWDTWRKVEWPALQAAETERQ